MARRQRAVEAVRRAWPYVMMAWERWQALPDDKKESYRRRAREYTARGRDYAGRGRAGIEKRRGGKR
jgi:hypothetical protein